MSLVQRSLIYYSFLALVKNLYSYENVSGFVKIEGKKFFNFEIQNEPFSMTDSDECCCPGF